MLVKGYVLMAYGRIHWVWAQISTCEDEVAIYHDCQF